MGDLPDRYRRGDLGWVRRRRVIVLGQVGNQVVIRRFINEHRGFGPTRTVPLTDFRQADKVPPDEAARMRRLAEET